MNKSTIKLTIGRSIFKIACPDNVAAKLTQLSQTLNTQVNSVLMKNKGLSGDNAFLIAALDIVEENQTLKAKLSELKGSPDKGSVSSKSNNNDVVDVAKVVKCLDQIENKISSISSIISNDD